VRHLKEFRPALVILALFAAASLFLSGCAETAARAVDDAASLHMAARSYVMEVHDLRRDIRRQCREMMQQRVNEYREKGDYASATSLLRANYPSLVTQDLVKRTLDSPDALLLSEPFGCQDVKPEWAPE
jgi:hypothetical protein